MKDGHAGIFAPQKIPGPHLQLGGLVGWCWDGLGMDFPYHMVVGKEDDYTKSTGDLNSLPCDHEPNVLPTAPQ